jgi:hypothetical protein
MKKKIRKRAAALMFAAANLLAPPSGAGLGIANAAKTPAPDPLVVLGVPRVGGDATALSLAAAKAFEEAVRGGQTGGEGGPQLSLGLPNNLSASAPLSAAVMMALDGHTAQLGGVGLAADWDGQEDLTADHQRLAVKPGNFSTNAVWTRTAISEHTIANGFDENLYYLGDSLGNVYVVVDDGSSTNGTPTDVLTINLPTVLNAFGTLNSDSQIVVTGLAVNPVADLTSFKNVNGAYDEFDGVTGEILYVSFWDTGGGLRLTTGNQLVRSGLLAFPISDTASPALAAPSPVSDTGFPVTVASSFGVLFSVFSNVGGIAVDDDGSVYFHQVDLLQKTGANIVELASVDNASWQDRSLATNSFITITTLNPTNGLYGMNSGPSSQISKVTNYSGTSTTFGNIVALAAGSGNSLYAAVARSKIRSRTVGQTVGLFSNPRALGSTPSMIINFADYSPAAAGELPTADGFADVNRAGSTLTPGVNNFHVFALGDGPERRGRTSTFGSRSSTTKVRMQIDHSLYSGLTVDEAGTVYVVSGGTPAGVGLNPSPSLGEILAFPDIDPPNRRADRIDFRGDQEPIPPASGGSTPDGDADRYDYLYWQAPVDQLSLTSAGVTGLSRGFLRYLNRPAANAITNLPNGAVQTDNAADGPIVFEDFDPSHQVAGGDDQNPPLTGDDRATAPSGGFEFTLGGVCSAAQNEFYLNANGSVSFGAGDADETPTAAELASGAARIAGAWADLNPDGRMVSPRSFPVQALGFAGPNHFKTRWINVPQVGEEANDNMNTFAISLFDDGTGADENASGFSEGPTVTRVATGSGPSVRLDSSGFLSFDYGRMDLTGAASEEVVVGYSVGAVGSVPAETNLSGARGLVGTGAEDMVFEFFESTDYDLRFEGSTKSISTPSVQPDRNQERLDFRGKSCS